VHAVCADAEVIGAPFYVMEHLSGLIPRANWPAAAPLEPPRARLLCREVWQKLAQLHALDTSAPELAALGKGAGYIQRQVAGWTERLRRAHTPGAPDFHPVAQWLEAHRPPEVAICVIHNDFRLDNVVFHPTHLGVLGVLDWEMCTLGDPLMDLGSALAYWVDPSDDAAMQAMRRQPSTLPGMLTRTEIIQDYLQTMAPRWNQSADQLQDRFVFYEIFGLFRLAGILQQIYARHVAGRTADPRFADFGAFVHTLHRRCLTAAVHAQGIRSTNSVPPGDGPSRY
jgi:aminoglycoside phosphotransferase (APT) family kinase protein